MSVRVTRGGMGGLLALAGVALAMACASTTMDSTWTDPGARGADLDKLAVIYMSQDEGLRRMAEDEVARQITSTQVVPSYQALGGVELDDKTEVRNKLKAEGYDGVIVMRLAGVSENPVVSNGPYGPYGSFDAYYDWAAPGVYGPAYMDEETTVRVLSNVYDINQNKLIWSGVSETFDPTSAKNLVDDVSKKVGETLEKEGIIP